MRASRVTRHDLYCPLAYYPLARRDEPGGAAHGRTVMGSGRALRVYLRMTDDLSFLACKTGGRASACTLFCVAI